MWLIYYVFIVENEEKLWNVHVVSYEGSFTY